MSRRPAGVAVLAVFAAATLYFAAAAPLTLEYADEGQVVYPSWRVCGGALPYRDFTHIYGPSLFFANGGLLCLFGPDLRVVRAALIVLKAITATLVYALARRLAPRGVALGTWAWLVALSGSALWLANAPYADHYVTPLVLGALLVVLGGDDRRRGRAALAGLLIGLAATFKQTAGLFSFLGLAVFLIHDTARAPDGPLARRAGAVRALRLAVLLGALVVPVAYVAPLATGWSAAVLLAPVTAGVLVVAARERHAPVGRWQAAGLWEVGWAGAGMALPLAAYAAFFAVAGGLRPLVFDTLLGLPQRVRWFVPFPHPDLRTILWAVVIGAACAALGGRGARRTAATIVLAVAAGMLGWTIVAGGGLVAYLRGAGWQADAVRLLVWIPLAALWAALRPALATPAGGPPARRTLALCQTNAAANLLQLHPCGDLFHVLLTLPLFAPLVAAVAGRRRAAVAAVLALLAVATATPFVRGLVTARRLRPAQVEGFSRASGIWDGHPQFDSAVALVRWLETPALRSRSIFIVSNAQLLYFLADRPSPVERDEFVLYLVEAGLLGDADARALVPEDGIIRRLEAARPLVLEEAGSPSAARFRRAFPEVARWLDARYRPLRAIDGWRVLDRPDAG